MSAIQGASSHFKAQKAQKQNPLQKLQQQGNPQQQVSPMGNLGQCQHTQQSKPNIGQQGLSLIG